LEHGGWARAGAITRKFGTEEGDGYYWENSPPTSPLGRLRLTCLVFVGRATVEGKRVRVAAVPADLRQVLHELIGAQYTTRDSFSSPSLNAGGRRAKKQVSG